ncbi:MAG TPA: LysR family transcriptional regulator [Lautropia sp.]|jgi:DNA-binding transcriptional LysR family regulator|nr:LysR family transcriptional regulator [Lautropia sp.]
MFDWDDLKYFLSVAHHGSTLAASRALGVDQSTVQRRVAELERRVGLVLIKRERNGYRLTEVGESLLTQAERIQLAVEAFERDVTTARDAAIGVIRVTCPEPLALRLSRSSLIDRFHALHPGLQVDFVMSDRYLDLTKGEADIALRSGDTDHGELIGRKIGDSLWAVYASRQYVDQFGMPERIEDMAKHALVGFDDSMAEHRAAVWLRAVAPGGRIVVRNNSVLGVVNSAKAGMGLAALPTAIGDSESDLLRVLGPIKELSRIWRVLTTAELRRQARVATFFDYIVEEVDALRPIITG